MPVKYKIYNACEPLDMEIYDSWAHYHLKLYFHSCNYWQYVKTCTYHQLDAANTLPIHCQLNWIMPIKPLQHMSIVTQGRVLKNCLFWGVCPKRGGWVTKSQNLIIHGRFLAEKYKNVCLHGFLEVLFWYTDISCK